MLQKLSVLSLVCALLGVVMWSTHTTPETYPPVLDTHLQTITQEPHPLGSAANERVGKYILSQIPETYAARTQEFTYYGEEMTNILAYLDRQADSTRVVSVHYDSAHGSYGAGDIGTGVAAALALLPEWESLEMDHNLLVIFVDGEEGVRLDGRRRETTNESYYPATEGKDYLLGSHYFVENYAGEYGPLTHLYNFEGRGTGGRLLLFESFGYTDAELVALNRRLGTLTYSLGEAILETQPNVTDALEYARLPGLKILNFTYIGEGEHYHTPHDSFENVDQVSKADTHRTMRRLVGGTGEVTAEGTPALYASTGLWTLSTPRWVAQIGAWLSLAYLLSSHWRRANYWLLGPILALLGVLALEFAYLLVWSGILFAAVYRYRGLLGSFYARTIVLAGSLGLWYSFMVVMGWLEGFGSVVFASLLALLGLLGWSYFQAFAAPKKNRSKAVPLD